MHSHCHSCIFPRITPAEAPVIPAEAPVIPAEASVIPAEAPVIPAEAPVIPAEAGIQYIACPAGTPYKVSQATISHWIPACAGMAEGGVHSSTMALSSMSVRGWVRYDKAVRSPPVNMMSTGMPGPTVTSPSLAISSSGTTMRAM